MPKKKTKNKKIKRIIKLIADEKLDDALELADINDVEDLLDIGVLFSQNNVHNVAEKIFDRVIRLNPNLARAWSNKGIALGNLGKYDESIKCYDEAVKINPNYDKAWYNKGIALGKLGKYDESIECYDEVIKINPNVAEAWSNKGAALGNLGKYDEEIKCYDEAIKISPNYDNAWFNKGIVLGILGKYDESIKCYDEAIKINPNYDKAWYNKGIALGKLGKYDESIKCYDEAIKINPNLAEAWYNKGIAFRNLGKDDEEIKCYDEAIKINPNFAEAWFNKGIVLGNLEKYDELIECYDEVIKINPNFAEAYGNKGINFLNKHKFNEAKIELKKAKALFSRKGTKNDVDKARKLELLAKNALELTKSLEPLDDQFLNCLKESQTLVKLQEKSWETSKKILDVITKFKRRKLPDDAMHLLIGKAICFSALSKALTFMYINIKELENTREIFEKWNLNTFATAVSFLAAFIRSLNRYENLEKISKEAEEQLLQILRTPYILDVLNGKLTSEIASRFRGEPYTSAPAGTEKPIEVKYVSVADTEKESVRVCLVQLDFSLTKKFPYKLASIDKSKIREKVFEILEIAQKKDVDIICFPELSFTEEWIDVIKSNYKNMMIICGSYYDGNNRNISHIIIDGRNYPYAKCHWSMMEEPNGKGLKKGDKLFVFQTKYGMVSVLTCIDFDYEYQRIMNFAKGVNKPLNIIINPRYDMDKDCSFQGGSKIDLLDGSRNYTFTLHVNAKRTEWGDTKGGGGTTIICYEHKHRIEKFRRDGLRPQDNIKYKICEAKDEMVFIADLYIKKTTEKRIKMGDWYRYNGKQWVLLNDKGIWL